MDAHLVFQAVGTNQWLITFLRAWVPGESNGVALSDLLSWRLSILLAEDSAVGCSVPASAAASGVVHGGARARLDPAHAQRIIGITSAGDQGLIALAACQTYVRGIGR